VDSKRVRLTIEYWDKGVKPSPDEKEPFAESIMRWVGAFLKEPKERAMIVARFAKPTDLWRSRFNLPFKVTMAGAEVAIDGVSLELPRNAHRAMAALLMKSEDELSMSVHFIRLIEFGTFNIADEVASFNEAIKLFAELVI
jgi:hypothetical protein